MSDFSNLTGTLSYDRDLANLTWLRVGGPADLFFQPSDVADLSAFLSALPQEVPVFPIGVGSNLIVRDGGLRAAVIRLGRGFNEIEIKDDIVTAGAAALDAHVARRAATAGRDLTFLRTIPGTIGGALRMNAGCYGSYVADHLIDADVMLRDGAVETFPVEAFNFDYRSSTLPQGAIILRARLYTRAGEPSVLEARMQEQLAKRDASQPTKERSAGSTFRNPAGYSSTGAADDVHDLKAWKLIDEAGLRGAQHGGAQMSPKHPNFLINANQASAQELEELGEKVREKVLQTHGIELTWEIMRIGEFASNE